VLGYYSLTMKEFSLRADVSRSQLKKLHADKNRVIKTSLIGQIGKNSSVQNNPLNLKTILNHAFSKIEEAQRVVGTSAIALECEHKSTLIDLYKRHGFKEMQVDKTDGLVTMYTKLIN